MVTSIVGACLVVSVLLIQSENSNVVEYESYDRIPGIVIRYPADMIVLPQVPSISDAGFYGVAMRNFTPKTSFFLPSIAYLRSSDIYIQINEFDANRWEQIKAGTGPYPEEVALVGAGGLLRAEHVQEQTVTVGDMPAVQRRILFRGPRGRIEVWFTYFEGNGKPFQAILLAGSSKGKSVYNAMLGMLEVKR
jgi:hypothetical protein